jgi:hypothetical protein
MYGVVVKREEMRTNMAKNENDISSQMLANDEHQHLLTSRLMLGIKIQ